MKSLIFLPFLVGLALLAACVETDISVPGFPQMVEYFSATEAQVQLTMSLNFLGFCLAGLIHGPLSDSFGRRPVLLLGNLIFLISAIGTATATSIGSLIAWRFFQGVGASAAFTVVFAIVADAYKGERASQLCNRLNACITAVMAGAPMAGGILVEAFGWRSTYSSVAVLCLITTVLVALMLPETNGNKLPFKPKQIVRDFWMFLKDVDFLSLTIGLTLQCAGYMAFVAGAVFVYTNRFNLSLTEFTIHQGFVIATFSGVSFFGGHINRLMGARKAMLWGLILNVIGGAAIWMMALLGVKEAIAYTAAMCIYAIGVALCYGVTFTASMELFPNHKGAAASLNASIRLFFISIAIWGAGTFADGTFLPEATLIVSSAILAAGMLAFVAVRERVRPLLV